MTVSLNADIIALSGSCGVEEVDTLVGYLESQPDVSVDLGAATEIHTALWQALIAFRAKIVVSPMSSLVVEKLLAGVYAGSLGRRDP